MIHNLSDMIDDGYEVVRFSKTNRKTKETMDFEIKIRGLTAYDIAEMWQENAMRDIVVYIFNDLDLSSAENVYHGLVAKAPMLITTFIAICDYDKQATPDIIKLMPVSAQIECFNHILNLTFHTDSDETEKVVEQVKKLINEASLLMKLFSKEENKKNSKK